MISFTIYWGFDKSGNFLMLRAFFRVVFVLAFTASAHLATAGVVGKDQRQFLADYAKSKNLTLNEARNRFAASGRIRCPWGTGSAFLVGYPNIVVTARHVIFPRSPVQARTALEACEFGTWTGKEWHISKFRALILPKNPQVLMTDPNDWIVLKLLDPVIGALPYKVATAPVPPNTGVTVVLGFQDSRKYRNERELIVEECKVRNLWYEQKDNIAGILENDCSSSGGASGSPVLINAENPEVIGLMSSNRIRDCPRYRSFDCSALAMGFSNELKAAIEKLESGSADSSIVVIQRQGFKKKNFPTPQEIYDSVKEEYLKDVPKSLTSAQATVVWQVGRIRFESEACGERLAPKAVAEKKQADFEQQLSIPHDVMAREVDVITSALAKKFHGASKDETRVMCQNASYARFEIHESRGKPRTSSGTVSALRPALSRDTVQSWKRSKKSATWR